LLTRAVIELLLRVRSGQCAKFLFFWGGQPERWRGQNLLGYVVTEARAILAGESQPGVRGGGRRGR
jgi:hypothetical protein